MFNKKLNPRALPVTDMFGGARDEDRWSVGAQHCREIVDYLSGKSPVMDFRPTAVGEYHAEKIVEQALSLPGRPSTVSA